METVNAKEGIDTMNTDIATKFAEAHLRLIKSYRKDQFLPGTRDRIIADATARVAIRKEAAA